MTDPQPVVVITLKEIWEAVTRLTGRVDVLISQQDTMSRDQQEHERESKQVHKDHEARIRALEKDRWPKASVSILVAIVSALLAAGGLFIALK